MRTAMYAKFCNLLKEQGIEHAARTAKELGFTSVEFFDCVGRATWIPSVKDVAEAKQYKQVLDAYGLDVACYSVAAGLYETGMQIQDITLAERELMRCAEIAQALHCPYLHHTLTIGSDPLLRMQTAQQFIIPAAIRIAQYAHSLGVTCIYEDQGPLFNGVEGFAALYYAVKKECPWVGVCGDVGNVLFVDETPVPFFRAYAKDMLHIHLKDYILTDMRGEGNGWSPTKGGKWTKETIVGKGCLAIEECLQILQEVGYTGAYGFENNHEEDFILGTQTIMELLQRYSPIEK